MPRIKLTDRFVASVKALNGDERTEYFDTVAEGLVLRSGRAGLAWYHAYTSPRDGKWARVKTGTYPAVTLADARGRSLEAATQIEAKIDPRHAKRGQSSATMTIDELVDAYVSNPEKAALRSIREIARRLRRNVVPKIGAVALSQLRRRDVRNVTEALTRRGAATEAARVFEDVHAMLRWAVHHEYLAHSPIEGHAQARRGGASRTPFQRRSRTRAQFAFGVATLLAMSGDHPPMFAHRAARRGGRGHDARRIGLEGARVAAAASRVKN